MEMKVVYPTKEGVLVKREASINEWIAELKAGRLDMTTPILYAELDGKNIFYLIPEGERVFGSLLKILKQESKKETVRKTASASYISYWEIPVVWKQIGFLKIPTYIARTKKEAVEKAEEIAKSCPLPKNKFDSFAIDEGVMPRVDEYKTGADFWFDLVKTYGTEALSVATHYLEIPFSSYDPENPDYQAESRFRKELLQAIAAVK